MDLRAYYQNIRKIEAEIKDGEVVVVSHATPDGGRRGVKSEVARSVAARMIAEDKARLATADESAQFRAEIQAKWRGAISGHSAYAMGLSDPRNESPRHDGARNDGPPNTTGTSKKV